MIERMLVDPVFGTSTKMHLNWSEIIALWCRAPGCSNLARRSGPCRLDRLARRGLARRGQLELLDAGHRSGVEARGGHQLAGVDEGTFLALRDGLLPGLAPQVIERECRGEGAECAEVGARAEGRHESAGERRAEGGGGAVDEQQRAARRDHLRGRELVVHV